MSKRNTVQINMEVFDNWLKGSNYKSPKEFCEKELGLSDGWYYGIRKNNGKGVKTLVAQLIANKMGIDIINLLYWEMPKNPMASIFEVYNDNNMFPKPVEDSPLIKKKTFAHLADSVRDISLNAEKTADLLCEISNALNAIAKELESQEAKEC